jgi:hypothetical protein
MDLFTTHTAFVFKEDIIHILSQLNFTGVSYQATLSDDAADTPSFLKDIFDAVVTELGPTESSPKKLLHKLSTDTT